MPAPRYLILRMAAATVSPIFWRAASLSAGDGRFLEDLLVAPLQRAVALAEMDRIALTVAENLDLDVARLGQILLHVDLVVAEGGLGFGARGR